MNDTQILFAINLLIGILIAAGGWWMKNMWEMLRELQSANMQLAVKLAEGYVPRGELEKMFDRLFKEFGDIRHQISDISQRIPPRTK